MPTAYDLIAEEFAKTRRAPWPEFHVFLNALKTSRIRQPCRLLDAGCGNGRLADFFSNEKFIEYTGIDESASLLEIAKKNHPTLSFERADILRLPFQNSSFDTVWSIAVIHHFPTPELQQRALRELRRVLAPSGLLMLTVWNLWNERYEKHIDVNTRRALIPWGEERAVKRLYYAFTNEELTELLTKSGFDEIDFISQSPNFAVICHEKN